MPLLRKRAKDDVPTHGEHYPPGWDVPAYFNFTRDVVETLSANPLRSALTFVDREGIVDRRTFHEVAGDAARWAHLLRTRLDRRDRVVFALGNVPAWHGAMLGALKSGLVSVPCTNMLRARDLAFRVRDSQARLVVADRSLEVEVEEMRHQIDASVSVLYLDEALDEVRRYMPVAPTEDTSASETALILYTSGTTKEPRGVVHTHAYTWAQHAQATHWLDSHEGDVVWCTAGTGSAKAVWNSLLGPWSSGAEIVVHDGRFDAEERLSLVQRLGVTILCQTPTEYRMLGKLTSLGSAHLPRLRHAVSAGEPLNPEVIARFQDALGLTVYDGYGQTETSVIVANTPSAPLRPGSMGLPTPGHDVAIIDDDGHVCPPGVEGDLALMGRPPTLFVGYWEAPDETDAAFRDGWYVTGDRAIRDEEGQLWFVGRADDVIVSSAYRIGPFEVESALLEHPAVAESAVVGVPDADRGQIVKAFVVLRPGQEPTQRLLTELQDHVKAVTAPYKYPRAIAFVDELPMTESGKIRRSELRLRGDEPGAAPTGTLALVPDPPEPSEPEADAAEKMGRPQADIERARAEAAAAIAAAVERARAGGIAEAPRPVEPDPAQLEAEERSRVEAAATVERARIEAEERARTAAEEAELARLEASEARARAEAEAAERIRIEAELAARRDAEAAEAARLEAAEIERARAAAEVEERARLEAEEAERAHAAAEAEERARLEAEEAERAHAAAEAEERARLEAEEAERAHAAAEAEERARLEAEEAERAHAAAEAEERSRLEAEARADAAADASVREADEAAVEASAEPEEDEEEARARAEEIARVEAEIALHREAADRARLEARAAEAMRRAAEAQEQERQQAREELVTSEEHDASGEEQELSGRAARRAAREAEKQARADEKRQAEEAKQRAKEDAERLKREEAEARIRAKEEEAAAKQRAEDERRQAKLDAEQRKRDEAAAREEAKRREADEKEATKRRAEEERLQAKLDAERRKREEVAAREAEKAAEKQRAEEERRRAAEEREAEKRRAEEERRQRQEAEKAARGGGLGKLFKREPDEFDDEVDDDPSVEPISDIVERLRFYSRTSEPSDVAAEPADAIADDGSSPTRPTDAELARRARSYGPPADAPVGHTGAVSQVVEAPIQTDEPSVDDVPLDERPWVVIVWNDPINLMSYVTLVLQQLFGYSRARATRLMLQVHNEGKAAVSSGTREKAELDVSRLHGHGLWATMQQD